ncbi:MAG: hypothetical protein V1646_03370 [bacterium]
MIKIRLFLLFLITMICNPYINTLKSANSNIFKQIVTNLKQNQSPEIIDLLQQAEQKAENLENQTDLRVKKLQEEASEEVTQINKNLEKDIEYVSQNAQYETALIKKSATQDTQELTGEARQELNIINDRIKTDILKFKKDAALKILEIIDKADEEALKIRKAQREQMTLANLQKSIDQIPSVEMHNLAKYSINLDPIPENLKISAENDFNSNTAFLQKIILDAEDPNQISDFMNTFEKQKIWFDKTLRSSKYLSDPNYTQIINKNSQLDFIATAIKKSDSIIEKLELSAAQKKQLRLKLLYEINSIQKQKPISDNDIRALTINIIEEISGKKSSEFPELKLAKVQFREKAETLGHQMLELQLTNKELLNKVDENQKITTDMKKLISELNNQKEECRNKIKLTEQVCDSKIKEQATFKSEQENKNKIDLEIQISEKETAEKLKLLKN